MNLEQFCPTCDSENFIASEFDGLLECIDCGAIFVDDAEEVEYIKTSYVKKQRKADKRAMED